MALIGNGIVTVVTSSWQRATTVVNHACASIDRQDYTEGKIEHIVVIDGDDNASVRSLIKAGYHFGLGPKRIAQLGRNWSSLSGDGGFGATCRLVGSWMAAGDLITYLDDDNDYWPTHISEMTELFTDPAVMFALSAWTGGGVPSPRTGQADTSGIMHRPLALKHAGGIHPDGYEGDGHFVERMAASGLQWAVKPSQTFTINGYHHGAHLG
jgi:hypothetical protein